MKARPMRTAPKDGRRILACMSKDFFDRPDVLHYHDDIDEWHDSEGNPVNISAYEFWAPIPKVKI